MRRDLFSLDEVIRGREAEPVGNVSKLLDELWVTQIDPGPVSSENTPRVLGDDIDLGVILVVGCPDVENDISTVHGHLHLCIGGRDGVRTRDTRNHNPMLYQLSYSPVEYV